MKTYRVASSRLEEMAEDLIEMIYEIVDDPIQNVEPEDYDFDSKVNGLAVLYHMTQENMVEAVRDLAIDTLLK